MRVSKSRMRVLLRLCGRYDDKLNVKIENICVICFIEIYLPLPQIVLMWIGCGHWKHGMFVVRIEKRLPAVRIVNHKVLFEKLSNNVGAGRIAQKRGTRQRQFQVVRNIKSNLWWQINTILCRELKEKKNNILSMEFKQKKIQLTNFTSFGNFLRISLWNIMGYGLVNWSFEKNIRQTGQHIITC